MKTGEGVTFYLQKKSRHREKKGRGGFKMVKVRRVSSSTLAGNVKPKNDEQHSMLSSGREESRERLCFEVNPNPRHKPHRFIYCSRIEVGHR